MDRPTNLAAIPAPGEDLASLQRSVRAMKAVLDTLTGSGSVLDKAPTLRELLDQGTFQYSASQGISNTTTAVTVVSTPTENVGYVDPRPIMTTPPTPTNLVAGGAFANVILTWDLLPYRNHAGTQIWRNTTNNLATALMLDMVEASVYADASGTAGQGYYYWVRAVNLEAVVGAFNSSTGTYGGLARDPGILLAALTAQITASQLHSTLGSRIDLIDAAATVPGSVAANVKTETDARVAALALEVTDRNTAISTSVAAGIGTAKTYTESWAYSKAQADSAVAASSSSVRTDFAAADSATLGSAQTYTTTYSYAKSAVDGAINAMSTTLTTAYQGADTATLNSAKSYADSSISTYAYSKAQADSAIASSTATISARLNTGGDIATGITSAIQKADTAQAAADGKASASSVTTLQSQIAGTAGSSLLSQIQTVSETTTTRDGYLGSMYSVRTSLTAGGRTVVGGFGLSGTSAPGAGPEILFGVRADKFYIGAPDTGAAGVSDILPFVVQTTDQTINGVVHPKGVYMASAYIKDLQALVARLGTAWIDDAKIANLSAAKITAGTLDAARIGVGTLTGNLLQANTITGGKIAANTITGNNIVANTITADLVDSRGLSIKDASGNIILAAGTPLAAARITPDGNWLNSNASSTTNLLPAPHSFATNWSYLNGSLTASGVTDKFGSALASRLTLSSSPHDLYLNVTGLTAGATYRCNILVQRETAANFALTLNNAAAWNTGESSVTTGSGWQLVSAKITVSGTSCNIHLGAHSNTSTQQLPGTVLVSHIEFVNTSAVENANVAVGGGNLLKNPTFKGGSLNDWSYKGGADEIGGVSVLGSLRSNDLWAGYYSFNGDEIAYLHNDTGSYISDGTYWDAGVLTAQPVAAGTWMQFQLRTQIHRAGVQLFIIYLNSAGQITGYGGWAGNRYSSLPADGTNSATWRSNYTPTGPGMTENTTLRLWTTFQVPPGTVSVIPCLRMFQQLGATDQYVFMYRAMLCEVPANCAVPVAFDYGGGAFRGLQQITPGNVSTFIANAAIGTAQVGQLTAENLTVTALSNTMNGGVSSGARMEFSPNTIKVYDASGTLRVKLGNLA